MARRTNPNSAVVLAKMDAEEAKQKSETTVMLRNALRCALDLANRSETFAAQNDRDGTPIEDVGVYGLVNSALRLMGDDDAIDHFINCGEWLS